MDTKIGALRRKEKKGNGPIAKGSLDFSRMPEDDKLRLHDAFVKGEKVYITVWQNRHDEGDKKPDLSITMDKPWKPGDNVDHTGQKAASKPDNSDDIPF